MREDATLMQLVTTDWSPSLDQLTFSRPRFPDDEDEPVRTIIDEPYPQGMCVYVCGGPQLAAMRLPTSLRRLQPISSFDSTCEHFPFPPSLARRLTYASESFTHFCRFDRHGRMSPCLLPTSPPLQEAYAYAIHHWIPWKHRCSQSPAISHSSMIASLAWDVSTRFLPPLSVTD